jgi:hypothetical protein
VNTNVPAAFQQKEKNWPNYQPFEPHLKIGFRFQEGVTQLPLSLHLNCGNSQ